jgi:hypothetical protein
MLRVVPVTRASSTHALRPAFPAFAHDALFAKLAGRNVEPLDPIIELERRAGQRFQCRRSLLTSITQSKPSDMKEWGARTYGRVPARTSACQPGVATIS